MESKYILLEYPCYINIKTQIGRSADGNWALITMNDFADCKIGEILQNHRREESKALSKINHDLARLKQKELSIARKKQEYKLRKSRLALEGDLQKCLRKRKLGNEKKEKNYD